MLFFYLFPNCTKYCWTSVYTCQAPSIPFPTWNRLWRTKVCVEVSEIHESNTPKSAVDLCGGARCCSLPALPSCFHTQYRVNSCDLAFLTHIGICKLKINTKATFQNKTLIHVPSGIGERTHCLWRLSCSNTGPEIQQPCSPAFTVPLEVSTDSTHCIMFRGKIKYWKMEQNYQKDPFYSNGTEEDLYEVFLKPFLKDLTILSCAFHVLCRGF